MIEAESSSQTQNICRRHLNFDAEIDIISTFKTIPLQ